MYQEEACCKWDLSAQAVSIMDDGTAFQSGLMYGSPELDVWPLATDTGFHHTQTFSETSTAGGLCQLFCWDSIPWHWKKTQHKNKKRSHVCQLATISDQNSVSASDFLSGKAFWYTKHTEKARKQPEHTGTAEVEGWGSRDTKSQLKRLVPS